MLKTVFQNSLLMLKIYSAHKVNYKFLALATNFGQFKLKLGTLLHLINLFTIIYKFLRSFENLSFILEKREWTSQNFCRHIQSSKITDLHEASSARGIDVYLISTLTNRKAV